MAKFFAVQPPSDEPARSFADADRLSLRMLEALPGIDIRLMAIRSLGHKGFVYGFSSRSFLKDNAIVRCLRTQASFAGFEFSAEADSLEVAAAMIIKRNV